MKYRVTFEVHVPAPEAREQEVKDWIRFSLHENGYLAGSNPLVAHELSPVPGTVEATPKPTIRVETPDAARAQSLLPVYLWRRGPAGRELVARFDSIGHARKSLGEVVVWERADHSGLLIELETVGGAAYLIDAWG